MSDAKLELSLEAEREYDTSTLAEQIASQTKLAVLSSTTLFEGTDASSNLVMIAEGQLETRLRRELKEMAVREDVALTVLRGENRYDFRLEKFEDKAGYVQLELFNGNPEIVDRLIAEYKIVVVDTEDELCCDDPNSGGVTRRH